MVFWVLETGKELQISIYQFVQLNATRQRLKLKFEKCFSSVMIMQEQIFTFYIESKNETNIKVFTTKKLAKMIRTN